MAKVEIVGINTIIIPLITPGILSGTTIQENINNGMWNYGAALSLIMLVIIFATDLFSDGEEDRATNEGGII